MLDRPHGGGPSEVVRRDRLARQADVAGPRRLGEGERGGEAVGARFELPVADLAPRARGPVDAHRDLDRPEARGRVGAWLLDPIEPVEERGAGVTEADGEGGSGPLLDVHPLPQPVVGQCRVGLLLRLMLGGRPGDVTTERRISDVHVARRQRSRRAGRCDDLPLAERDARARAPRGLDTKLGEAGGHRRGEHEGLLACQARQFGLEGRRVCDTVL
jgi:hypothetical protein